MNHPHISLSGYVEAVDAIIYDRAITLYLVEYQSNDSASPQALVQVEMKSC